MALLYGKPTANCDKCHGDLTGTNQLGHPRCHFPRSSPSSYCIHLVNRHFRPNHQSGQDWREKQKCIKSNKRQMKIKTVTRARVTHQTTSTIVC